MQLKVYVYSAFKVGVGHLPNKNFETSDSRVHLCPASIGGDWDWLRRGFSGEAQDGQRSPVHKCRAEAVLGPGVSRFLKRVARDNRVQKKKCCPLDSRGH